MRSVYLCTAAALFLALNMGQARAGTQARRTIDAAVPTITTSLVLANSAMAACLPRARAQATIVPGALNDTLTVNAIGLLPFAGYDLFITALPHPPYGPSFLLSKLQADDQGTARTQVRAILLGAVSAGGSSTSAGHIPITHLVLAFDRVADAAVCADAPGQTAASSGTGLAAGPAVLATSGYPDAAGPLRSSPFPLPGLGISTPSRFSSLRDLPVTFTSTCSDPAGWTAIRYIDFRLTTQGTIAFWARLDRMAKRIYLWDPASRRWLGGGQPGSAGILTTPVATLHLAGSKVLGSTGTTGKVLWRISFSSQAVGQIFIQSVQVTDLRNQTRGWNPSGTWSVR